MLSVIWDKLPYYKGGLLYEENKNFIKLGAHIVYVIHS